ncbi:MAG: AAA family ATPase, partial [Anaerolineales bacterium]|nr:AAA family ATPase [Anaerolineales bacterium]
MDDLIFIDGLPPGLSKGRILRLLIEDAGIRKDAVGRIQLAGGLATIGLAPGEGSRAVKALDGIQIEHRLVRVWAQPQGEGLAHFARLRRWLALEAEAEKNQKREDEPQLSRLVIKGSDVGLGGRYLLKLAPRHEQADLPATRLAVGAPVVLEEEGVAAQSWRAVVSQLGRRQIELALGREPEPAGAQPTFTIRHAADEVSRQRMERALTRCEGAGGGRVAELREILLGQRDAYFRDERPNPGRARQLAQLNPSQQEAVRHALAAEDIAIIHGPPGTGKTMAVAALIQAAVAAGERVLACAPSNLAVDNIAERLAGTGLRLVRIGHPARILPQIQELVLEVQVENEQTYRQAKRLRKEAAALQVQAGKFRRARPEKGARSAQRREAGEMFDEARLLEAQAVEQVLDRAQVVLVTLTGIDSAILGQREFDTCVIDEAGQSTEPACWIPVSRSRKLVLAGDHQQLPPTILSPQAAQAGLGCSLMERLMRLDGARLARRLDVQYRMHEQIMGFSAAEFYEGTLLADPSVATHLLTDWPDVAANELTSPPLTFIDTAGASFEEEKSANESRRNPEEAALVARQVAELRAAGVPAGAIGVITPYSAQVDLLKGLLPDEIEVNSIDGFQGREKEVIL